jgi:hypothetical protein
MKLNTILEAKYDSGHDYFVWVAREEGNERTLYWATKANMPSGVYKTDDFFDGEAVGITCRTVEEGVEQLKQLLPHMPTPWAPGSGTDENGLWDNEYHGPPEVEYWDQVQ